MKTILNGQIRHGIKWCKLMKKKISTRIFSSNLFPTRSKHTIRLSPAATRQIDYSSQGHKHKKEFESHLQSSDVQ